MATPIRITDTQNPRYNYSSPFVRCTIVRSDGFRYPLWSDLGLTEQQKESVNLTINALPYVQDVAIEIQAAYLPIMKVKMVFPYKEGIAFLNSKLIEWSSSTLEVIFGYTGGSPDGPVFGGHIENKLSPKYEGVLLIPDINIDANGVEITLNAQGVGGFAASNTTRSDGPYVGKRIDLLERVFVPGPSKDRRLKIDFSNIIGITAIDQQKAMTELYRIVEVSTSGKTDWTIIYELLQECDCWMVLVGDTIVVHPRAIMANRPTRLFRHYDYQNGDISSGNNTYPVMRFNTNSPAIYMPSEVIGYYAQDLSSANPKEVIQKVVDHKQLKTETSGASTIGPAPSALTVSPKGVDGLGFFAGSPETPQWVSQMEQDLKSSSQYVGMKINIDTLGMPDLLPLEIIAIRGFGERIDNDNYCIFKINHSLGTSGFTTQIEAYKNVSGQTAAEITGAPAPTGASSPHTLPEDTNPNDVYAGEAVSKLKDKLKKQQEDLALKNKLAEQLKKKGLKGQALDNAVDANFADFKSEQTLLSLFGKVL